ncbi:hypothetical protein HYH03_018820 [Edaphochlamys debaryana]|uniref:Proteasome assembly chaperone 2 n=1 Tax=Edaphochlamys debaryana TaxID=47281 RepID=A0A835XD33_9CHLO|nr:hypothetical protein HYH03_018820 [Edaphochlamys debaryana]|eukprot:KAG2482237.1 hypothetical protein HYH03_018820 [Edaphochlamys debaryana]
MLCSPEALQSLKGAVVVLPAVSYANVGELAVDVLVASLQPASLGPVESVNVLPAVGNDAFDAAGPGPRAGLAGPSGGGALCTALELFGVPGRPLVFLQQRAPAMLGRQAAFAQELVSWLVAAGAAAVVVLTGLDAGLRGDRQLDSSPFRFLASSDELRAAVSAAAAAPPPPTIPAPWAPPPTADPFAPPLAAQPLAELEPEVRQEELELHHSLPPWPVVQECTAQGLPYVMLGCFAAEGDNGGEGLGLAGHALRLLGAMRGQGKQGEGAKEEVKGAEEGGVLGPAGAQGLALRTPGSWVGLYGRSYPMEIF